MAVVGDQVLIKDEEQCSLWQADQDVPASWRSTGTEGSKEGCVSYVDEVWTDMRPRSLRERMAVSQQD